MLKAIVRNQSSRLGTPAFARLATPSLTAVRFATATTTPAIKQPTPSPQDGKSQEEINKNLPVDSINVETPNFEPGTRGFFDIKTRVYNNQGIMENDDDKFLTKAEYNHVEYTEAGLHRVKVSHRTPETLGDKVCWNLTMTCRRIFDFVTGFHEPVTGEPGEFLGTRYQMTEGKWMTRVIFLESIAAIPGNVASMLRALRSCRLLKRDKAWIESLRDEAENERMHLLTFIKIGKPSWFTRSIMYVGQGIFTNAFFLIYLINPRYCHRFVGTLEEEAVKTYTLLLKQMKETDELPLFDNMIIPTVAVDYWPGLAPESSFYQLILQIRADESKHREINHTLANLDYDNDRNPFALQIKGVDKPQPNMGLDVVRPNGWARKDLIL
ncbi:uncharacterized protein LODBEIA_P13370 [Lodderomyces beijingensis]|uniref:Alternative oxidase n=1 Tax=Lodderomyces beijingensis TaxID=1775926 RepID=A0ABP0ZHL0_9ASCO